MSNDAKEIYDVLSEQFSFFNKGQRFLLAHTPPLKKTVLEGLKDSTFDKKSISPSLFQDNKMSESELVLSKLFLSLSDDEKLKDFKLNELYDYESYALVELIIKTIEFHFRNDVFVYQIPSDEPLILKDNHYQYHTSSELVALKDIAELLVDEGEKFDIRKISSYKSKGYLPKPTITIGNKDFWDKSIVKEWIADYKSGKVVTRRKNIK